MWTPARIEPDTCLSSQSSPSTRASSLHSPASQHLSASKENRAPRISNPTPSRLPTVQENDGLPAAEEAFFADLSPSKGGTRSRSALRPPLLPCPLDGPRADPPVKNTFIQFESPNKARAMRSPPKTEPPFFAPEFCGAEDSEPAGQFHVPFPVGDPACLSLAGSFDAAGAAEDPARSMTVRISDYLPQLPEGPKPNKGLPLRISDFMPSISHVPPQMPPQVPPSCPQSAYGADTYYEEAYAAPCYPMPGQASYQAPYQPEVMQELPAQMLAALHSVPMEQFLAQLNIDPSQVQYYVAQMLQLPGLTQPPAQREEFPLPQEELLWPPAPSMPPQPPLS